MKRSEAWNWIVTVLAVIGMFYHASRCSEIERAHKALLERVMDDELDALERHAQVLAIKAAKKEPEPPVICEVRIVFCDRCPSYGTSTSWLISP